MNASTGTVLEDNLSHPLITHTHTHTHTHIASTLPPNVTLSEIIGDGKSVCLVCVQKG